MKELAARLWADLQTALKSSPLTRLSIRTKFLLMMLLASLAGLGIITYLASRTGKDALTEAAFTKLTSYRAAKKQQIEWYFNNLAETFSVLGTDRSLVSSFYDLRDGYEKLDETPLTAERQQKLDAFYNGLLPILTDEDGRTPLVDEIKPLPDQFRAFQLHALYITENNYLPGERWKLARSSIENPYTLAHARHHPWIVEVAEKLDYYDLMMFDLKSNSIIYSFAKEPDLGTNVVSGPFARTNMGRLVRDVLANPERGKSRMSDYEFYPGSGNVPAAFIATPIYDDQKLIGVFVGQISFNSINTFLHNNRGWVASGLGESGSAYLAGVDRLMRSETREILEDRKGYYQNLEANNEVTPARLARIKQHGTSILLAMAPAAPIVAAEKGESGTNIVEDNNGKRLLVSYAPLDLPGLKWVMLTQMDEREALAAQTAFSRTVLTVACLMGLLSTLLSLWLARSFLRPVTILLDGIDRLRKGERNVTIADDTHDEFGDLAKAFNGMAADLKSRDEVIESKNQAYSQLLKRIFPDTVANRMREGKSSISETFGQVTVIYAIVEGLETSAEEHGVEASSKILNELVDAFDNAADATGVEKVKTIGDHYLAVSGLDTARLDHAKRALDFAVALHREVVLANGSHNLDLALRVGIATGPAQAGLVGNRRFVYDIWGSAASLARRIVYESDMNAARLNAEAYQSLMDKSGIGEELKLKLKSFGSVDTFQFRFAGTPPAPARVNGSHESRSPASSK